MAETNQFPSRIETEFGERNIREVREVKEKEFHPPHLHGLSPLQKFLTVVELIFTGWLIYVVVKVIITNIMHLSHVL